MPVPFEEPIAVTYTNDPNRFPERNGFKDMRVQTTPLKNGRTLVQWFDAPTYMRAFFAGNPNHAGPIGMTVFVDGEPFKAVPLGRNGFTYLNLQAGDHDIEVRLAYPPGPGSVPRYSLPLQPIEEIVTPPPNVVDTVTVSKNEDLTVTVSFNNTIPEKDKYIITLTEQEIPVVSKTIEEQGTSHSVILIPPSLEPEKEYVAEVKVGESPPVVSPTPITVVYPSIPKANLNKWYVKHGGVPAFTEEGYPDPPNSEFSPDWAVLTIRMNKNVGVEKFRIVTYATELRWRPTMDALPPSGVRTVYEYEGLPYTYRPTNQSTNEHVHYVRIPKNPNLPWQIVYVLPQGFSGSSISLNLSRRTE
jgi:hypothetical protein